MINRIIEVGGHRWRVEARDMQAALNEIGHARCIGSVGSRTIVDNSLIGGGKELLASVHRLDANGKDEDPRP